METEVTSLEEISPKLLDLVACPRDKQRLQLDGSYLMCGKGHRYRIVEGVPILLISEAEQTHIEGDRALKVAETGDLSDYALPEARDGEIDPFVRNVIGATNGNLYQHLVGKLSEYPIPHLRLPRSKGSLFLEIGSNWGRWSIAAARLGYRVVGVDPSLRSILAARRVSHQLGVPASFLVADGRYLPFGDGTFQQVFSYSVLQHLSRKDAGTVVGEIARVLVPSGRCLIQMPNVFGVRCLYHQARRGFREGSDFDVRYWTIGELKRVFGSAIGSTAITVDGFFSLNPQISDVRLLSWKYRPIVYASEALRYSSRALQFLTYFADSLYVNCARK
jgi:SAM-dependent methyltransferase